MKGKKSWKQIRDQKVWKQIREWKQIKHGSQGSLYVEQNLILRYLLSLF